MPEAATPWGDGGGRFATTRWSLIATAADPGCPESREALATLCRQYWLPLYAYARRRCRSEHDARDRTQSFFQRLLERGDIAAARPERGRFRAYLLTAFKHHLIGEAQHERAQKRGGGQPLLSLDFDDGDGRLGPEPPDDNTPEQEFERRWVGALLGRVFELLRAEAEAAGKSSQFELLRPAIAGRAARGSLAEAARRLGMSEGAVRMAAQRLRERYRELLRAEVAQTLLDPAEIDDEIASLFAAVRPSPKIL